MALQTNIFQTKGWEICLVNHRQDCWMTKATKETHKSSIFSINKDLKLTTTIVYSTRSSFVLNHIICASEGDSHSRLMLHSHGIRQMAGDIFWTAREKTVQRNDGWQNKTPMMMCCYGDVILFTKNEIKYILFNYFMTIILCSFSSYACIVKCGFFLIFYCKLKIKVKFHPEISFVRIAFHVSAICVTSL